MTNTKTQPKIVVKKDVADCNDIKITTTENTSTMWIYINNKLIGAINTQYSEKPQVSIFMDEVDEVKMKIENPTISKSICENTHWIRVKEVV